VFDMNEQFVHIATILVEHNYFTNGILESMEITAQSDTLITLNNLSVLVKPFAGGVHLLTSQLEGLRSVKEVIKLEIRCHDPYFINYTLLPEFRPTRDLCYFSNRESHLIAESSKLGLHKSFVSKEDILTLHNNEVILDIFDPGTSYVFSSFQGVLDSSFVQQPDTSVNRFIFHNVSEGVINVAEEANQTEKFYYHPNALGSKPLGVIDISLNALYDQFMKKNETVQYAIQFTARRTYWEYYFSKDSLVSYENIAIINTRAQQKMDFKYLGENDHNIIYRSISPLPLSQSHLATYQLVYNFTPETAENRKYKMLINQLPIPSPNQLYPNRDNPTDPTKALFSHIYIHI